MKFFENINFLQLQEDVHDTFQDVILLWRSKET